MQMSSSLRFLTTLGLGFLISLTLCGASVAQQAEPNTPLQARVRPGQAATLLPDGRWLITGGAGAAGPGATATIWDPHTQKVMPLSQPLRRARAWHTATVLPDGSVFIFGGFGTSGRLVSEAEVFTPAAQTFTTVSVSGLTPRAQHTATLLTDGSVLFAGGLSDQGDVRGDAELWNPRHPASETVLPLALQTARRRHTAVLLAGGTVLLWGGAGETGLTVQNGETYDPVLQQVTLFSTREFRTPNFSPFATPQSLTPSPQVVASLPVDGAGNVPLDSLIALRFSQPVRVETVTDGMITLSDHTGVVPGAVVAAEGGMLAFVIPHAPLRPNTPYVIETHALVAESEAALPPVTVQFTTTVSEGRPSGHGAEATSEAKGKAANLSRATREQKMGTREERATGLTNAASAPIPTTLATPQLSLLQAKPGKTALTGQVLTLEGKPLAGVTLKINKRKTRTDQHGQFLLVVPTGGLHELEIDGRTANRGKMTYGFFEAGVELATGQTTILPYIIWMPEIDTEHTVTIPSPTTSEIVVTTPRIPGLELHLPAGTVITDHDGKPVTQISITPIPVDRPPFPMPRHGRVPIYFTIQPGGAYLSNATGAHAWLVYPNTDQLPPGTEVEFIYYDPEEAMWETVGLGAVSTDGQRIVPNPGVGVEAFTGSTILSRPFAPSSGPTPCDCQCGDGGGGGGGGADGDPCDLGTGLFLYEQTDLVIPDVIPIVLKRTYRTNDGSDRPFGIGMSHEYELYINLVNGATKWVSADLLLPNGGQVSYNWLTEPLSPIKADWRLEHTATPSRFYKSKLSVNADETVWAVQFRDGTVYELAGPGAPSVLGGSVLRTIRDRNGNTLTIHRKYTTEASGTFGDITRIVSPNGRWVVFAYDAGHHITQATDNLGRTVTYTYNSPTNGFGRLMSVTDVNGGVTAYTYDSLSRMLTVTDPRGTVTTTNQYDANGRIFRQTLADGGVYQFAYTVGANNKITQTDVTDPRGKVRRVTLNSAGYRVTDTRALGQPEQQTTTLNWQAGTNLLLGRTDPLGRQTTYTYDALGNTTSLTRLAGTANAVTTTFTYEPVFNQIATITDPLNHTTTFAYNAQGNVSSITDATNRQVTFTYNGQGQPVTMTTPAGTTQLADALGDLSTVTDPLGNVTSQVTDGGGRVLRLTNPTGQMTQYTYDVRNRLTQVTDPLGLTTAFTYDANDNLLTLTDARSGVTQYTYDGKNRVATRKDALLRQESFVYDGKNNLTQSTDRKGQITNITYDSLNRPTVVTYQGGATVTSTYDAGDRVTQMVDSVNGTITRSYDGLDRLLTETTPQGSVTYTYDTANRRTSMIVAGQAAVNYTYDNANRLTQITQGSDTASFTYDSSGRRSTLTLPNGVVATYGYDVASRLTSLTYTNGASTLGNLTYSYDKAGRRLAAGGMFARTGVPPAISTANYDAANQQLTLGIQGATYDNNGNLATLTDTGGTTTYTWNSRDQLTAISGPSLTASFTYDAFGRRQSKTVNGTTTNFLYDGLNVVQELTGTTPVANLITGLGIDETLLRTDSAGARSFLTDGLGSSVALTDSAGTVLSEYTYEPFGKTTANGVTSTNAFKYTGREDDGTGLYYYRARYYHPSLQRFISQDPIGFDGGDVNLYAYVSNDPVNFYDPEGESAAAVAGAIAEGAAQGGAGAAFGVGAKAFGGVIGSVAEWIFPPPAGGAEDMLPLNCPLQSSNVGPSGKPKRHNVDHPTRKRAKDAAQNDGQGPPMHHPKPNVGKPPFHPTDAKGNKIPGVHHNYP